MYLEHQYCLKVTLSIRNDKRDRFTVISIDASIGQFSRLAKMSTNTYCSIE